MEKTNTSWQFGRLLNLRNRFKKGIRWIIGNEKKTNFWSDLWVTDHNLQIYNNGDSIDRKVADFIDQNGGWNFNALLSFLPIHIVDAISQIKIKKSTDEDQFIWDSAPDGLFSVKNAIKTTQTSNTKDLNWIWKSKFPPHIKNFLWKACSDALPSKERLNRYFNRVPSQCVLCQHMDEDNNHIFFKCPFSINQMNYVGNGINHVNWQIDNNNPFLHNINEVRKKKGNFDLLCFLWWSIWCHRNNLIFRQSPSNNTLNPGRAALTNYSTWFREFKTNYNHQEHYCHDTQVGWKKPPPNIIKLNFDGSYKDSGEGQIGVIFRDNTGRPIYIHSARINSTSAINTEAGALLVGLRLAKALGFKRIIAEGDNLATINVLNGKWRMNWRIKDTIEEIREEIKDLDYLNISHCYREANKAADYLASKFSTVITTICNPMFRDFLTIIRKDVLGYTFARRIV